MIDEFSAVLLRLLGQVHVTRGGLRLTVAELQLQATQIETGFNEMGGITVAQGMNRHTLADTALIAHPGKGFLGCAAMHGFWGMGIIVARPAREQKARMLVTAPESLQDGQ